MITEDWAKLILKSIEELYIIPLKTSETVNNLFSPDIPRIIVLELAE